MAMAQLPKKKPSKNNKKPTKQRDRMSEKNWWGVVRKLACLVSNCQMLWVTGKDRKKEKRKDKIPLLCSTICCPCRKMPSAYRAIFRGAYGPNCWSSPKWVIIPTRMLSYENCKHNWSGTKINYTTVNSSIIVVRKWCTINKSVS